MGLSWPGSHFIYNAWQYRELITIPSLTGGPYTRFPMRISDISTGLRDGALSSGSDIIFVDVNGNRIPDNRDNFVKATGALDGFVTLSGLSTGNRFYRYFGNPNAPDSQNPTGTFIQYVDRWGLNEPGVGTRFDTLGNFDATPMGYDGNEDVAGKIDRADNFDGSNYLDVNGVSVIANENTYMIEGWFKSGNAGVNNFFYGEGNSSSFFPIAVVGLSGGTVMFAHQDNVGNFMILATASTYLGNIWHKATACRYAANSWELFVDGVSKATDNITTVGTTTIDNVLIGAIDNGGTLYKFIGTADEHRLSLNPIADPNYHLDLFNSEYDPSSFYTVGAVETKSTAQGSYDLIRRVLGRNRRPRRV